MIEEIHRYCRDWPSCDSKPWLKSFDAGSSILSQSRVATSWRDQTRKDYTVGFTHGLRWLAVNAPRSLKCPSRERWSPELLLRYVRDLSSQGYQPTSIYARVVSIDRVLSQIARGLDRTFISLQMKKLSRYPTLDKKTARLKDSAVLRQVGKDLMDAVAAEPAKTSFSPVHYRTGFQIALLAARPLRLRNFASLEIGRHIRPRGCGYWISVPSEETKKDKQIDVSFPDDLVEYYNKYVAESRAELCGTYSGNRLWVSSRGGELQANGIYKRIVAHTELVFGPNQALNPHLFRDCLATSIAIDDPEEWDLAHRLLGNEPTTVERHYDHGRTREAGLQAAEFFAKLRSSQ